MYTYGQGTSCRTADEAEALRWSVALRLRWWMVLLKVRLATYYLLPRKAPVFDYSTAYHSLLYLIYTATSSLLTVTSNTSSFLIQSPISRSAIRASQPAPCSSSTRKHLQPQQAIDGYVQHISLNTLSAEPSLVTAKPKHVF